MATIQSVSNVDLYLYLLDLETDGTVSVVTSLEGDGKRLRKGESVTFKLKTTIPEGRTSVTDVLEVFATVSDVDFGFLEQAPISLRGAEEHRRLGRSGRGAPRLRRSGREPSASRVRLDRWTTEERVIHVKRRRSHDLKTLGRYTSRRLVMSSARSTGQSGAVEIFFSYAHEDEDLRDELEKHLSMLKREGLVKNWHDRRIAAGEKWGQEIDRHLETAHLVLLLISPDFLASEYCYEVEMKRALERHEAGETRVIPVILRPADWMSAPFGRLQALPRGAIAVTKWRNRDDAFLSIAEGIRDAIAAPSPRRGESPVIRPASPYAGATSWAPGDFMVLMATGTFSVCIIILVAGTVAAVLAGKLPPSALTGAMGVGLFGSVAGLALGLRNMVRLAFKGRL